MTDILTRDSHTAVSPKPPMPMGEDVTIFLTGSLAIPEHAPHYGQYDIYMLARFYEVIFCHKK